MALPNKTKIPVGTVLQGKYRITREIGRGGMAAVYEAANVDIGKRVAIKVLAQELTTSAVVVERFLREARAAAAIRSPYICDIYDSGKLEDGRPFLVLELLEGESLYERMTKIRWLDIETTTTIVSQVCRGLTKAHAASIVHRDLKPENIFLTKDEESNLLSKILDFGLAKFYAPMETDGPQTRLTREGAVFGTPAYMSPEQVRGQGAVDQRADLWALGCIVYECFTGRTVWSTEQGVAMTFAQIANAQLPRPATYRPDLPETFTAWFDRALNRDITQRFQTAKEFADAFGAVFNRPQIEVSSIGPSPALSLPQSVRDSFENPFLSGGPVSVVPAGGARQVATDATTEPPPPPAVPAAPISVPRTSAPHPPVSRPSGPLSSPSVPVEIVNDGGRPSGEPAAGPASPRPSKLGFAPPEAEGTRPKRPHPLVRAAVFGGGAAAVGGLGFLVWTKLVEPPVRTGTNPDASTSVAPPVTASADPTAATSAGFPADAPQPPWMPSLREGQQALAAGDLKQAAALFKAAYDKGSHGVPRTMGEHLTVAMASSSAGPCRLTGLGRPRTWDLGLPAAVKPPNAGRPSIAVGPKGAVMVWTDSHDEHAYAVALDDALRDKSGPLDVTPEGSTVRQAVLDRAGDNFVIVYANGRGAEAGVHARLLNAGGGFAGPLVSVTPPKAGSLPLLPGVTSAPDGTFYVAWTEEGDPDSEDLFLRHLSPALDTTSEIVRATDLVPAGPSKARVKLPSLAVAGGALQVAFRLEREPLHLIYHLRVPLADADKGVPAKKGEKKDRFIGEAALVNPDKAKSDTPSLACGGSACFVAWHVEQNGGAWVGYLDPAAAKPFSRWQLPRASGHPAVAVSASGQAQVTWFEAGKVVTASVSSVGVGPPTRIARIAWEREPPSITAGSKPGEWYLAWLDFEAGHLEAYAARVQCK